ncbi:His-Xaa-Ser system protein HxsD [Chitinophaga filiformis]|uniref:His-Xaa-Ser system protein HxsD n=1 Tax=Chitinophaga filiformis TaxID=104663 RepID=A0A1G7S9G8_CHIFI|nr:His-Xaa-Ser system protein HxsD [Chitinophaga filiformis]SDG19676.1 His-Xaa-Ser system protein HxsD [Chitinophaga filiformis]
MEYQLVSDILKITVNAKLYSEAVLFKCFYWYGNTFEVDINKVDESLFQITLKYTVPGATPDWNNIISRIKRDLIDFRLRQIVTEETRTVRELIIAKAFAYYEEDEAPVSSITDPVGFDPQCI